MMREKIVVGLIFGGRSEEHEISLLSAQGVMGAIDKEKYEVLPIGITKEGHWLASGDPLRALSSGELDQSNPAALLPEPSERGLVRLENRGQQQGLKVVRLSQVDVMFPILHGPYGEDGTLQGLLELAGMPYVGAGVAASAVGMDKALFKDIMRAHQLPVVNYLLVKRKRWVQYPAETLEQIEAELGYACFVKPANLGSSIGVTNVRNRSELQIALDTAAQYDRKILIEKAVDAREIEVSVLGNDKPIASVPGEVVPCNEFYDYAAKYLDGDSELLIPAPVSAEAAERIQRLAIEAFLAIDGAGMARVDFLLDRHNGKVYINELNTLPGFTPISMYPKLWEASGISYTELIDRLIQLGLERHADRGQSATSYQIPEKR